MGSYSINELYEFAPQLELRMPSRRSNPLTDDGALNEAEFIDMRLSPQRSRVGVIFDTRWCHFEEANTVLVVLTGVGKVTWSNDGNSRQHPWYSARGYWRPTTSEWSPPSAPQRQDTWAKDVSGPEAAALATTSVVKRLPEYVLGFDWLSASGLEAQMYIGHVAGLGGTPPDMGELPDAKLIGGFPQWSSLMTVTEHYSYPDVRERE
jgi:hypothetical protein